MGGHAFSAGKNPLFTPRMPKEVYNKVREQCAATLRQSYQYVASPIDGPNKVDFGDVDIMVAQPKNLASIGKPCREILEGIRIALSADRLVTEGGQDVAGNFAVPWPTESDGAVDGLVDNVGSLEDASDEKRWVQVDVRVCTSLDHLEWMLFKHAHGDIWNLLGTTIRPCGLTVDEVALWLRVPEIEKHNRKRAKIFLSSDPVEVLQFLGLPLLDYWLSPFPSLEAMNKYVTNCRFFTAVPSERDRVDELNRDLSALKANDRRRMNYRPVFSQFVQEFVPRCREQGLYMRERPSRTEVMLEAFRRFHVEREYVTKRDGFLQEQLELAVKRLIKETVSASWPKEAYDPKRTQLRSCTMSAFKKIILEGDATWSVEGTERLKEERGFWNLEEVGTFVKRWMEAVQQEADDRHHSRYLDTKKASTAG